MGETPRVRDPDSKDCVTKQECREGGWQLFSLALPPALQIRRPRPRVGRCVAQGHLARYLAEPGPEGALASSWPAVKLSPSVLTPHVGRFTWSFLRCRVGPGMDPRRNSLEKRLGSHRECPPAGLALEAQCCGQRETEASGAWCWAPWVPACLVPWRWWPAGGPEVP